MKNNVIKILSIILLAGFSFFYTEKVTKIVRKKDPIMIKINEVKEGKIVDAIKPIINNDEYIMGINGCIVDIEESYSKMKTIGEFKEELIVMKEVNEKDLKDKYIVGGNKINKNVSIILFIKNNINENLINYLDKQNIKINYFIEQQFLEDNLQVIKFLSEKNNIYYLGNNGVYEDKYMLYSNNLISINSNNESKYCLLENKNEDILKLCNDYGMKTIKTKYLKEDILNNIKNNLENGSIIAIDSNDIDEIKVSLNYIKSKGYNIVSLDNLLNNKGC